MAASRFNNRHVDRDARVGIVKIHYFYIPRIAQRKKNQKNVL